MRSLTRLAVLALLVPLAVGCGAAWTTATPVDGSGAEVSDERDAGADAAVAVPDVLGLTEGEAARALDAAGLVMNVRYDSEAPREGTVFAAFPTAGAELAEGSIVIVHISLPPRLPLPRQEHEGEIIPFSRLITRNPDVFVGLYRDLSGVPHAVFGPGADPEEWLDRLDEAAAGLTYPREGLGYGVDACPRSHGTLRPIQDEVANDQSWSERGGVAFGIWVDPQTCTVRVESDLLRPAEIEALVDRYGTALSFNTTEGSHPRLRALTSRG